MRSLIDLVLLGHAAFVLFTIIGGFLALRWQRLVWLHLPCALWGATVELTGWICPLTPLENSLRSAAGEAPYAGGFIAHYISVLLYPVALTRATQIMLGTLLVAINVVAYSLLWRQRRVRNPDSRRT